MGQEDIYLEQIYHLQYKISSMLKGIVVVLLVLAVYAKDPPTLPPSYFQAFDETVTLANGTKQVLSGQLFYDAANNRERVDRTNGRYDLFCSSVLPNVTTPCTHTVVDNKRYLIYPVKRYCCYCCESAKGCGVLKQNWLEGAEYLGTENVKGVTYDKWMKEGGQKNYWWATTDSNQIPRRLQEGDSKVDDYQVFSFINKTFEDSVFAIPDYCSDNCPLTSICGNFRETQLKYE